LGKNQVNVQNKQETVKVVVQKSYGQYILALEAKEVHWCRGENWCAYSNRCAHLQMHDSLDGGTELMEY